MKLNKSIFSVVLFLLTIGCIGCGTGENAPTDLHTLDSVVITLNSKGIQLQKDTSKNPEDFEWKGIKPAIFTVNGAKDNLLIYVFPALIDNFEDYYDHIFPYGSNFVSKNVIIVVNPYETTNFTKEYMKAYGNRLKSVSDTVFKYLNDGKKVIYVGESEHWAARATFKYFNHWWVDEEGKSHYQNYSGDWFEIQYKKDDIQNVGPITFEYKEGLSGGVLSGATLDSKGYANLLGGEGVTGSMPWPTDSKQRVYHVKVKWNGYEEEFDLTVFLAK